MKIAVVSNMYPDQKHPSYGIFVKKFCSMLEDIGVGYKLHVMLKKDSKIGKVLGYLNFYVGTVFSLLFESYDLIYVHYASHSSIPVLLARKLRKKPIYTNVHGSDVIPENPQQEKLQKYTVSILNLSNKIIVPSEYFKKVVISRYGTDGSKIHVFPSSGVDKTVFHPCDEIIMAKEKKKYNIPEGEKTFTFVGRISTGKGWDTFARAIKILKEEEVKANFVIVGNGNKEEELDALIEQLNIKDIIIRLPLLSQEILSKIYSLSDVLIFPTEREGESLGLVALEAMACGTPVIASDYAAPKYYVENGKNGYKFEKGNFNQLASIMREFIDDNVPIEQLKRGALETSLQYDANTLGEHLFNILNN